MSDIERNLRNFVIIIKWKSLFNLLLASYLLATNKITLELLIETQKKYLTCNKEIFCMK